MIGVGRRGCIALNRQSLAALVAAPFEDDASRAGAHAGAEPVGTGALALLRLVGALHVRGLLRRGPGVWRARRSTEPPRCAAAYKDTRELCTPMRTACRQVFTDNRARFAEPPRIPLDRAPEPLLCSPPGPLA